MINSLKGIIQSCQPPELTIEVTGIGYQLQAPMSTFLFLPDVGQQTFLYTHMIVRDDAHLLYGFASEQERALFRALIKISGVGAKIALVILSGMSVEEFRSRVQQGDDRAFACLPGIGKKTAARLIVEMQDRMKDIGVAAVTSSVQARDRQTRTDAIGALIALGYKEQEATQYVNRVYEAGLECDDLIRRALKNVLIKSS